MAGSYPNVAVESRRKGNQRWEWFVAGILIG